jgi:hypothetical protein
MEPGRELKMALQQCAGLLKDFEQAHRGIIAFF